MKIEYHQLYYLNPAMAITDPNETKGGYESNDKSNDESTALITEKTGCDRVIGVTIEIVFACAAVLIYFIVIGNFCREWIRDENCHYTLLRTGELIIMTGTVITYIVMITIGVYTIYTGRKFHYFSPDVKPSGIIDFINLMFVLSMLYIIVMLLIASDYISARCSAVVIEVETYRLFIGGFLMLMVILCMSKRDHRH